jgi:hypothetical protein
MQKKQENEKFSKLASRPRKVAKERLQVGLIVAGHGVGRGFWWNRIREERGFQKMRGRGERAEGLAIVLTNQAAVRGVNLRALNAHRVGKGKPWSSPRGEIGQEGGGGIELGKRSQGRRGGAEENPPAQMVALRWAMPVGGGGGEGIAHTQTDRERERE